MPMRLKIIVLFVLLASLVPLSGYSNDNKKLTLDLYLDWEYVQSPQISPDGNQVLYSRRWTDKINDKFETDIWIANADGSRNRFLLKGSSPQWSPDGKRIAYIAPGQPSGPQIWVKWLDSAEETQLTRLERAPSNIAWSPDGRRIAFNMNVPSKPDFTVKMPTRPSGAKWIDPPRVIDRLDYRSDGVGYRADGYNHIFIISDAGGTPRQLTDGDYSHGSPEWTPDSQRIVFSAVRKPDADYLRFGQEIYSLSLADGNIRALTDRDGVDANPTVSPDGKLIAYTGFDSSDDTYRISKIYLMNSDGSNKRVLTQQFDRSPASLFWAPDNSGVYFTAEDRGSDNVWFEAVGGGMPKQLTEGVQQISISSTSGNGIAAGVKTSPTEPGDVVIFNLKQPSLKKITEVNADVLEGRKLSQVEEIWYDSLGKKIQGWIVKPPDFDSSKKYPLILYIHGGPHTMYGVGLNFEFFNHAAEGYLVLYTNPRGSSGYGQEFGNAIKNNYPGQDYDDLMNGVDTVIRKGYVDEKNLFVCGGSGGGVLTSWIVGHTKRFAAAVVMKPVINWYSFVGTTDGSSWYYNFKKLPWEDPSEHLRRSPITYVGNVSTPTMLITGELDLRTPMEETEQYYRALKLRKVETVMVRLPDEYHGFNASPRHPSNRLQQILHLRGWFDKYRNRE